MEHNDQAYHAMICVGDYSRFALAKFPPIVKPQSFIDVLLSVWTPLFGYPQYILRGNATYYKGKEWESVCEAFDMCLILAPTQAHHHIGMAERNASLIKQSFVALSRCNPGNWRKEALTSLSCMAKNPIPLSGAKIAPITLVAGRPSLSETLLNRSPNDQILPGNGVDQNLMQLAKLQELRAEFARWGANQMTRMATNRVCRKGSRQVSTSRKFSANMVSEEKRLVEWV